jgi:Translin family
MRRAINNISSRNSVAPEIRTTLRQLCTAFDAIYLPPCNIKFGFPADLRAKIEVMKASLVKVEDACYNVHVRGSEIPDGWTLDFIRDDQERANKRGERDVDEDGVGNKRQRVINDN